jgi:hypothetical protein
VKPNVFGVKFLFTNFWSGVVEGKMQWAIRTIRAHNGGSVRMPRHPKQSISDKKKYCEQRKIRIGAPRKKKEKPKR